MTAITIESGRLRLVPAIDEYLALDPTDRAGLEGRIGATVPRNWPPETSEAPGWVTWYLVFKHPVDGSGVVAGVAGLRVLTDDPASREIGCVVLEQFRRRGIAAEATALLVDRAFGDQMVARVTGEVFPDQIPVIGVLMKNGMTMSGPGSEPGTIRYAVSREVWRARPGRPV